MEQQTTAPMTELPKVAANFTTMCKKCGQDRYHKVLAHVDSQKAKVECEVCHKKSTFSIKPKAASKRPARPPKATAAELLKKQYDELNGKLGGGSAVPYQMTSAYTIDMKIQHPKFGVGFVTAARPLQIDVLFPDGPRALVQNRK